MYLKNIIIYLVAFFSLSLTAGNSILESIFSTIFHSSSWSGKESASGSGSDLAGTVAIRRELPKIIKQYNISTIVDAPCGDFWWMKELKLEDCLDWYLGLDIVEALIQENIKKYANETIQFATMDISTDIVPTADLIICRDIFLHIQFKYIKGILNNFKRSNSTYLLASTYSQAQVNKDRPKIDGGWRPINLEKYPFNFPKPILLIKEESRWGKHVGLWKIEDLPFVQ